MATKQFLADGILVGLRLHLYSKFIDEVDDLNRKQALANAKFYLGLEMSPEENKVILKFCQEIEEQIQELKKRLV